MKLLLLAALTLWFTGLAASLAADPASGLSSEIAGFVNFALPTSTVAGQPQTSVKSIGLLHPAEYQGIAEIFRGRILTDKQAVWETGRFSPAGTTVATATHYVEITTGPRAGAIFDIVKTDAASKSLTLGQVLPLDLGKKVGFRVRAHWTLSGLFGAANDKGLLGGSESTADLVQIYNGSSFDKFYFCTDPAQTGWRRIGNTIKDEAGHKIYPDDGLVLLRNGDGSADTFLKGIVKTDKTLIPISRGLNYVANVYQVPLTLATSRLYTGNPVTGLRPGAKPAEADQILIFDGDDYTTYYFQRSKAHGNGWRSITDADTDAGTVQIAVGTAFGVKRRGSLGFNWIAPALSLQP